MLWRLPRGGGDVERAHGDLVLVSPTDGAAMTSPPLPISTLLPAARSPR